MGGTMESVIIGIAGVCLGALVAHSGIPRVQLVPMICSLILTAMGVVAVIQMQQASMYNGLLFAFSALLAEGIYGAELWKRHGLNEAFSSWQLIWMSCFRPRYLRAVYEQLQENSYAAEATTTGR